MVVADFECNVDEFCIAERRVLLEAGRTHRVACLCVLVNLRREKKCKKYSINMFDCNDEIRQMEDGGGEGEGGIEFTRPSDSIAEFEPAYHFLFRRNKVAVVD